MQYIYPHNLKATANLWLWALKDFLIIIVAAMISIVCLVKFRWLIPSVLTLCFAFLTMSFDDMTVIDFLKYAVRYFISTQQYYEWR